jgi:hypothetical protein
MRKDEGGMILRRFNGFPIRHPLRITMPRKTAVGSGEALKTSSDVSRTIQSTLHNCEQADACRRQGPPRRFRLNLLQARKPPTPPNTPPSRS